MSLIVHEIDPDPDTIIILRQPCTTFALWEPDTVEFTPSIPVSKKRNSSPQPSIADATEHKEVQIHYRVSSRHLMTASPVFRRALTKDGFAESQRDEVDGLFHIQAEDWDPEAFLVILRIFHLRNKAVPRTVTLEMLAKIAVLVDYYECAEAIELFTDLWIHDLKQTTLPTTYCRDLVLWIWVSWVFDIVGQFKEATAVVVRKSVESIRTLDLPIPERVSSELDSRRYLAIESVVAGLHSLLNKYRSATYVCPARRDLGFQCGSFLLGALTKELDSLALLQPRPEVPFANLSFDGICEKVRTIKSPTWIGPSLRGYSHDAHTCTLDSAIVSIIITADAGLVGLNIETLKQNNGIPAGTG